MFAKKEPAALRRRLAEIDRDVKLGKFSSDDVAPQQAEILVALKKLGDHLDAKEEEFLSKHKSANLALSEFEAVAPDAGDVCSKLPTAQ